ncbi:methyl-accepting chemotaxis protein [Geoalkalibacter subterraneus]|uniref:Chemotaxis protein n=1 Tax=Geoalkalibacter subterraneus TaxID=483547 RepID=A0A0B5FN01_9BACT|nr:methyl-accepting chemotaxis protein [Geoalkalibacter subterraneus]AJF05365.1 chemotaxis protein [Geoalkalibacter subterraneus]
MLSWIKRRISIKISLALIVVLSLLGTLVSVYLVQTRAEALEEMMLNKARTLTKIGARIVEQTFQQAIESGHLTREEIFDTDYREIQEGPLSRSGAPKYHTAYDQYLDRRLQPIIDAFIEEDSMVVFAVPTDYNGYVPTHNSIYSRALTGDPEQDLLRNRTKQIFDDPVGLRAARVEGPQDGGILRQSYRRDTGERLWDLSAPISVDGERWGAFRLGFSIAQTDHEMAVLRNTVIASMLVLLAAAALTIYLVVTRIIRPLHEVTATVERISEGHLDETITVDREDEIGTLGRAVNHMTQMIVHNLKGEVDKSNSLIKNVKEAVLQLSSGANEIMAISAQQSSGATQQAAAVQQATSTSQEFAATARQVADNAKRVEGLAEQASQVSRNGRKAVEDASAGMEELRRQVRSVADAMLDLGENSHKIGGIVDIIEELSDQTNLLALNAAIEAAGAGESGKRFAVVANEVKRLAERTVEATNQIDNLIDRIQTSTNTTIMQTEEGTKKLDSAYQLVSRIAEVLDSIIVTVQQTTTAAGEITVSTQHQLAASEQMTETISEVSDVAGQVASSAEETAHAIAELSELAERLRQLVDDK